MTGRSFRRYLVTGGSAAIVDSLGFLLLLQVGLPILAAAAASFLVAAVWNYWFSSRYAFGQPLAAGRFAGFLAVAVVGLAINSGVTWLAFRQGAPPLAAKLAGIAIAFAFNYISNARLVFRPAPAATGERRD